MKRPLCDIDAINSRHQSIAVLQRSDNRVTAAQLSKSLKRMNNPVVNMLKRIDKLSPSDWTVWKSLVDVRNRYSEAYSD
jgi:hypothetical protein